MDETDQHPTTTPDDAVNAMLPAGVSPAALMEMAEDPENASGYARMLWYEQQVLLRQTSPMMTVAQRMEWSKSLQKVGRLESPPPVQVGGEGTGFRININIPSVGSEPERTVTIEASPPNQHCLSENDE